MAVDFRAGAPPPRKTDAEHFEQLADEVSQNGSHVRVADLSQLI